MKHYDLQRNSIIQPNAEKKRNKEHQKEDQICKQQQDEICGCEFQSGGQFYNYNFQIMKVLPNFPSSEEISFKLTQNLFPSFTNSKTTLLPFQSSLEYTYSRISIQQMLQDQLFTHSPSKKKFQGTSTNNASINQSNSSPQGSSLKGNSLTRSDLRQTPRTSSRDRKHSTPRTTSLEKGASFYLFQFQQETTPRASLIHSEPKRCKSQIRRKCGSARRQKASVGSERLPVSSSKRGLNPLNIVLELEKSMQIRQIKLRADEERERNYLKRILQTRMCSIHLWKAQQ